MNVFYPAFGIYPHKYALQLYLWLCFQLLIRQIGQVIRLICWTAGALVILFSP